MVERRRLRLDAPEGGRREPLRFERVRVDAPAGLTFDPLAFPWGSCLPLGWGPPPARALPSRYVPPAPRRRRPVGE